MAGTVLVSGGAGYIGSHVGRQLGEAGQSVVVLDNLSTGFAESVLHGELIVGDTGDYDLVNRLLREYRVESVMHFAAHTVVPESVQDPLKYYSNNTCKTRNLLSCCQTNAIKHFIFSSTAAVYGVPETGIANEDTTTDPINPYGMSKLMSERMLVDLGNATDLRFTILRYFNVAGCDPQGRIGQSTQNCTLLVKVACQAALGIRDSITIFGTDYATEDGTGVRDYVHVEDLSMAHLRALDYLRSGGGSETMNCGYGHGYSVRQVLNTVQRISRTPLNIVEAERRAGDPPHLVACTDKIAAVLDWQPAFDELDTIVGTSLNWERKLLG